jgi:excisionase family DNA binding protein
MAGKFLSLEEAARHLGVTIDEINRLVDRKKLFPMRDGATVKFRLDDIERVAAETADEASAEGSGLALDLDLSSPGLGGGSAAGSGLDDLVIDDAPEETGSIFGDTTSGAPSRTIVQPKGDDLVLGDAGSALASSDLELDSIIEASSPALGKGASPSGTDSNVVGGSGTLAIDLGSGSLGGLSGPAAAALSGAIGESGLSLEGDIAGSGVKLGGSGLDLGGSGIALGSGIGGGSGIGSGVGSGIGSGVDDVGGLGGDAFELGDATTDDESASVVISTEDSGDSSFFGTVSEDSGSVSLEDSAAAAALVPGDDYLEGAGGTPFSVLQIVGLVCCTLFLLTAALVMIDLVWSIRAPAGVPISSPLLKALTDLFSWR